MKQTNRYIKEVHLLHSIEVQTHSFTPILPCTKSHILQTISTSQNHTNQIQKHQSFSQFQNLNSIISCKTKHSHSNFHSESMKFISTNINTKLSTFLYQKVPKPYKKPNWTNLARDCNNPKPQDACRLSEIGYRPPWPGKTAGSCIRTSLIGSSPPFSLLSPKD